MKNYKKIFFTSGAVITLIVFYWFGTKLTQTKTATNTTATSTEKQDPFANTHLCSFANNINAPLYDSTWCGDNRVCVSMSNQLMLFDTTDQEKFTILGSYQIPPDKTDPSTAEHFNHLRYLRQNGRDFIYAIQEKSTLEPAMETSRPLRIFEIKSDNTIIYNFRPTSADAQLSVDRFGSFMVNSQDHLLILSAQDEKSYQFLSHAIYDNSTPESPKLLSTIKTTDADRIIYGHHSLLIHDKREPYMEIVDLSVPSSPTLRRVAVEEDITLTGYDSRQDKLILNDWRRFDRDSPNLNYRVILQADFPAGNSLNIQKANPLPIFTTNEYSHYEVTPSGVYVDMINNYLYNPSDEWKKGDLEELAKGNANYISVSDNMMVMHNKFGLQLADITNPPVRSILLLSDMRDYRAYPLPQQHAYLIMKPDTIVSLGDTRTKKYNALYSYKPTDTFTQILTGARRTVLHEYWQYAKLIDIPNTPYFIVARGQPSNRFAFTYFKAEDGMVTPAHGDIDQSTIKVSADDYTYTDSFAATADLTFVILDQPKRLIILKNPPTAPSYSITPLDNSTSYGMSVLDSNTLFLSSGRSDRVWRLTDTYSSRPKLEKLDLSTFINKNDPIAIYASYLENNHTKMVISFSVFTDFLFEELNREYFLIDLDDKTKQPIDNIPPQSVVAKFDPTTKLVSYLNNSRLFQKSFDKKTKFPEAGSSFYSCTVDTKGDYIKNITADTLIINNSSFSGYGEPLPGYDLDSDDSTSIYKFSKIDRLRLPPKR